MVVLLTAGLAQAACGIAFDIKPKPVRVPPAFEDVDLSRSKEEQRSEEEILRNGRPAAMVGMSLVVGGRPLDAGVLPKPPIPVVMVP
jgi:hypothetical protein